MSREILPKSIKITIYSWSTNCGVPLSMPQLPVTVLGQGRRRLDGSVTRMITPLCLADGPARAGMMLFQQRDVCP
ncbi:hypothetical protein [Streptomyces sannanensis]